MSTINQARPKLRILTQWQSSESR